MVLDLWQRGYPKNIPASLGQFWQDELISELVENIISKIPSILCFLSRECMLCGSDFPTDLEIQTHLESGCLNDHFHTSEEN